MAVSIRKGDTVQVLAGKFRGQQGAVLRVDRATSRVSVERINMIKKHQKPNAQNRQGGIIEREAPIHLSNVALVQPSESPWNAGSPSIPLQKPASIVSPG